MLLSHDIWHQIVQYLEHKGGDSNAAENRITLLNLALTSRPLSNLALATLWKNIDSMDPIVDIINYFTPDTSEPFLTWIDDVDGCSYWEFCRKPDRDEIFLRVKEYFSRVRQFWAYGNSSQCTLWPILTMWFWKGEPLLPNLRELIVYFDDKTSTSYHHLTLMVPSKLRFVATINVQSYERMVDFYQHLLSQGCSPDTVAYVGDLHFPTALTLFKNLNTLFIKGPYEHDKHNSPFSLVKLLQQVPSLIWLDIDLGTLQIEPTVPLDSFEHLNLEILQLEGTTRDLHLFLSSKVICPLVKRLSLKIRFNAELTWKFLFERVAVIFPNINDLGLQVLGPSEDISQLVFSDLDKLRFRPLEEFNLEGVPNKLSWKDLEHMLRASPNLRTLALTGGKTPFNAEALLSTPTYRNLHTLHLPFDFVTLGSPLTSSLSTQKSALNHLRIAFPTRFPSTLKENIMLAQNLFSLLPELKTVEMNDKRLGAGATDLQDIIKCIQAVIATRGG